MRRARIGIIFLISIGSLVYAQTIDAHYKVTFGLFGEIGKAKAHLERKGSSYRIEVVGEATGIARSLSRDRIEKQVSIGQIKKGLLVPDSYSVVKSFSNKLIKRHYTIDHKYHRVIQLKENFEGGVLVLQERKVLDFYANNDLLTLYFNMNTLIPQKRKKAKYLFKAVGAEKQQGSVEVIIPGEDELASYKKDLGGGAVWYLSAIIHQKIFSSSKGELILSIDKAGITQKAILKDVILFGDIVAKCVKQ